MTKLLKIRLRKLEQLEANENHVRKDLKEAYMFKIAKVANVNSNYTMSNIREKKYQSVQFGVRNKISVMISLRW